MNFLYISIFLPILAGVVMLFIKRRAEGAALCISAFILLLASAIFISPAMYHPFLDLRSSPLSSGMFLAAAFFVLINIIYSIKYREGKDRASEYYGYILMTLGSSAGVFFANDYLTLILFWGMLGGLLYMLVGISGPQAAGAAKKTLMIVGGTDALMVIGIAIIWSITKSLDIGAVKIYAFDWISGLAFICLISGALAKAGAMPFHSWIPEISDKADIPVLSLLPASLDKLLGIYFLVKICTSIFTVNTGSVLSYTLLVIGSFTIMSAVLSALIQHDMRKLLAYHAVSQVGYMVLGLGSATAIGMAGAVFHMFNHAIYKSCLFMVSGSVQKQAGTSDLDELGGLARFMPLTFISALVASLSISGIPPFNGFFSKWMVYQGLIQSGHFDPLWPIWLTAAMFGSALTLASFVKVIHSAFLGQPSKNARRISESSNFITYPMLALSFLCVIFGIFAFQLPLKYLIFPSFKGLIFLGYWQPAVASVLLVLASLSGLLFYWAGKAGKHNTKTPYIGGESLSEADVRVTATGFYDTISDYPPLKYLYSIASKGIFDIYEICKVCIVYCFATLSVLHNGKLSTYLSWALMGSILLIYMMGR